MAALGKSGPAKSGTTIHPCTCKNDYQDAKYGKGRRVHNLSAKGSTCTVCGTKKS